MIDRAKPGRSRAQAGLGGTIMGKIHDSRINASLAFAAG
jgi:hypothetical protein